MSKDYSNLIKYLDGSVYTVFTAFNKKLEIDYLSIEKYLDFLNSYNVKIFYVMPYNSRYSQLREKEIFDLNKFCIDKIKSFTDAKIIVSDCIHGPTELKKEYCLHAKELGADIFASICREKYFSDDQILAHYEVMNSCNIPILVHVMPFLSGYNAKNMGWPISIFDGLCKLDNVIAIKEDTKDVEYSIHLLKKFEPRLRFIFAGRKKYFLELFNHGLKSYLNGTSIICPDIDNIFLKLINQNFKLAEKFVKEVDDPFWDVLVKKYGWHRVNKASLEKIQMMKRFERLPMISLNNLDYKDVGEWVDNTLEKIKLWK